MTREEWHREPRSRAWPEDPVASPLSDVVAAIRRKSDALGAGWTPEAAVILGSGLSGFENRVQDPLRVKYADVMLPAPHVEGHKGELVLGTLRGRRVAVLAGRIHYYEGHDMQTVTTAARAMGLLGVPNLLVSNAAGAVNSLYRPGDLMVLSDHINLMGVNPLRGPNYDVLHGVRFPDMTVAYDAGLRALFHEVGAARGKRLHEGVYIAISGPSYETPAEIRAFRTLGADAVGMSTVPEVIAARHIGMRVAAVSCITNMAAGLSGGLLTHEEVKQVGAALGTTLADIFEDVVERLPVTGGAR